MKTMALDDVVVEVLERVLAGRELVAADALLLFGRVRPDSLEMGLLCAVATRLTQSRFGRIGEVFSQVGLNYAHCSLECGFCSFGALGEENTAMPAEEATARARRFIDDGANAVGLMATADYPFERFLEIGKATRAALPPGYPLAANVADFGTSEAVALREAGFTAVYHVIRLREGVDTPLQPSQRRETLLAARAAGLDVTYCLEPIGPEHSPEELVDGILRAREFGPTSMATMRRIPVPGTRLAELGQISEVEQARIQAITTLVCAQWPSLMMMGAHEPSMLFLRAGANRMTAEAGVNPRDQVPETSRGRGRTVAECARMVTEAGFNLRRGPSPALQGPLRK